MLIVLLATLALLFAFISVGALIYAVMVAQENAALLKRCRHADAEKQWAQEDALSAIADAVEAEDARDAANAKNANLSRHVQILMRERSQQQSLQLLAPRVFDFGREKSPAQKAATRSAHIN